MGRKGTRGHEGMAAWGEWGPGSMSTRQHGANGAQQEVGGRGTYGLYYGPYYGPYYGLYYGP